jgi:hypothetical protein
LQHPEILVEEMLTLGRDQIGQPLGLLRTYWYDGAQDGVPTAALKEIAALPRFKTRVGRISGGAQKGVDGLIILDLINLSLNRVIDVAILLSGDEDLRETVLFAQGHGVTVVLAGVPNSARSNQSVALIHEADFHLNVPVELLGRHIHETQSPLIPGEIPVEIDGSSDIVVLPAEPSNDNVPDDHALETLAATIVARTDFVLETRSGKVYLSAESDRILIRHLVTLTQTNPVADSLLRRARAKCVEAHANTAEVHEAGEA